MQVDGRWVPATIVYDVYDETKEGQWVLARTDLITIENVTFDPSGISDDIFTLDFPVAVSVSNELSVR